jgi:hypothetical protein
VLGETSRLDNQAALAVDRWNKQRAEQTFATGVAAPPSPPVIDLTEPEPELVAIVVDAREPELVEVDEKFVAAPLVAEPVEERSLEAVLEDEPDVEPEPVIALVEPEPEIVPEPEPLVAAAPSFLDLALAEHTAARAEPPAGIDEALDGDVNSIVDALHRKARGEAAQMPEADPPQVPLFDEPVVDRSARPLRLMASSPGNRRRWNRRDA